MSMADVSLKAETQRSACASGKIRLSEEALKMIREKTVAKGDVVSISRAAGMLGAKNTPLLLPGCHPVRLTALKIEFSMMPDGIVVTAEAGGVDRTGFEMEALTAAAVTLLNIYDMIKPHDRTAVIEDIKLLKKTGGKSGEYEIKS